MNFGEYEYINVQIVLIFLSGSFHYLLESSYFDNEKNYWYKASSFVSFFSYLIPAAPEL